MVKSLPLTCTGHSRPVTHLAFCKTPPYLMVSGCKDGNPILRHSVTGDWIGTFLGHQGSVWCVRLSSDAGYAISSSADSSARIWKVRDGELVASLEHDGVVRSADFMPNLTIQEDFLVVTSCNTTLRIWKVPKAQGDLTIIHQWSMGSVVKSVKWVSHDIIITALEGKLVWWRFNDQIVAVEHEAAISGSIMGQLEVNEEKVMVANGTKTIQAYSISSNLLRTINLDYPVSALAVGKVPVSMLSLASPHYGNEREFLVTGSPDDTWIRVHDWDSGELIETLKGHHGPVHTIQFSSDNHTIASGSEDGTIRIWKMVSGPYGLWQ